MKICLKTKKTGSFSTTTMQIIKQGRELEKETEEHKLFNKSVKKAIYKDMRSHRTRVI